MNLALPHVKSISCDFSFCACGRWEHPGSTFRLGLLLAEKLLLQPAISNLCVADVHGVVPLEHRWGFVLRELHNHRVVNSLLPQVGDEGMAPNMTPEVDYSCFTAGIAQSLLDLLEGFSLIGEDSVMIQGPDPPRDFQYIISPIAKEDHPGL